MNLSTIWYTVQDLFQQHSPRRRELKLYMFNIYLQAVDTDLLMQLLRMKFNPSSDVSDNDEQLDMLQKFLKSESVVSGSAHTLPAGYVRHVDDAAYTTGDVKVNIINMEEYADRKGNSIVAPSATYPVAYITNGTIVTDPTTIGTYTLWYYGANTGNDKPSLAITSDDSVNVYDSVESVELVWPEYMYPRIVMLMLKYLGISINEPTVIQEKMKEIADATT